MRAGTVVVVGVAGLVLGLVAGWLLLAQADSSGHVDVEYESAAGKGKAHKDGRGAAGAGRAEHGGAEEERGVNQLNCPPAAPCPRCPECVASVCPAPNCPACATCATCPTVNEVCDGAGRRLTAANKKLAEAKKEMEEIRKAKKRSRGTRYEGESAAERRIAAAKDDHLLLELPSWGGELTISDELAAKHGLGPDDKAQMETLYRNFNEKIFGELQKLYSDLVGDPEAGTDSTMNALIHNIMQLSPRDLCQERTMALLQELTTSGSMSPPGPDAPACEVAAYLLFSGVDNLEGEVLDRYGEEGKKALWRGTSSFAFSAESKKE